MIKKIGLILGLVIIIQVFSIPIIVGEMEHDSAKMEHDHTKDLSDLLKDEDESSFFSNQFSGDFIEFFDENEIQESSKNNILIKSGTTVTLQDSPNLEYSTILVEGKLRIIDTKDSALYAQKIIISPTGSLTIGDKKNPISYDKSAKIVFVKNKDGEIGIFVFGKLEINGNKVNPTFVGLESYAQVGDDSLVINEELENWKSGDIVVITSPGKDNCNEITEISNIIRTNVFIKNPLRCSHIGNSDLENSIVSHIALLSRNVKISSEDEFERGSVNFFYGSTGYIKYAQFDKLGPKEVLGRYPIHFHHLKDSSRGIEVTGNAITNSENRWITIHDSNGILVKNNVGYISSGHGFFLEDGNEFDNVFEKNIGIITKAETIRPEGGSSVFWTMNPMNTFSDNVAIDAGYWGFFFFIPKEKVYLPDFEDQFFLTSLPSIEFEGNTAYNNRHGGIKIVRQTIPNEEIKSSEIAISNFNSMSSTITTERHFGVLISGSDITISNSSLINHKFGIQLGGDRNKVLDTKIIMQSSYKPDSDISGILIAGKNNLIVDSEISGYVYKNNYDASDISLSNDQRLKQVLSAKVINSTLRDPHPFYVGDPANENSFLEIYGYNAPSVKTKKLAENFMLKKIGTDIIEIRGEQNVVEFDAMLKMIPDKTSEDQIESKEENDIYEKTKSEIIQNFKNKAGVWEKNDMTHKEFLDEIEILFESRLIEIRGVEQGSFQEIQFSIPQWVKKLVVFWSENTISDQEFFNALEYILKSNISENLSSYEK